jgi:hypothetical protein
VTGGRPSLRWRSTKDTAPRLRLGFGYGWTRAALGIRSARGGDGRGDAPSPHCSVTHQSVERERHDRVAELRGHTGNDNRSAHFHSRL